MLKVEDNKINVYSKINKELLKRAIKLIIIAIMIEIISLIVFRHLFWIILICFSTICFFIYLHFNKQDDIEKLQCTLSKDEFIIYSKKGVKKRINTSNIISFQVFKDPFNYYNDYNEVLINFKNQKGKKDAILYAVKGCKNYEFVDVANKFLKEKLDLSNITENTIPKNN